MTAAVAVANDFRPATAVTAMFHHRCEREPDRVA
jgi:hypothetical protein